MYEYIREPPLDFFPYEQFLIVWITTFITLSDLP